MIRLHVTKRRGISEIFATLMLLAITTAGSLFLANLVQGSGIGSVGQNPSLVSYSSYSIKLVGYDTRDGVDLSEISTLDNRHDKKLCTTSCTISADKIPINSGTEFIILQIKNVSPNPVFIRNLQINGVTHSWDPQTGGKTLDASADDPGGSGKYPLSGKFSIISTSGISQRSDNQLNEDEEVRLVVKLSRDISSDISLTRPLQIYVDFGGQRSAEYVVLSGETR